MSHARTQKPDIQQEITNNIITLLDEVDLKDYQPPFANLAALGIPENPITKNQYQGINILALWFNQKSKSLRSNKWASFKQWQQAGASVKKGEKGSRIIFYKTLTKENETESGDKEEMKIPMLRQYVVFNASQVEGFEDVNQVQLPEIDKVERLSLVDEFCRSTGADIRTDSDEAFYSPLGDYINMPETSLFFETDQASATENYYSTLLHELTHWTGAKQRLDRKNDPNKKAIENYAFEELIAELGAAFLCAQHNIKQTQPKDHALYIKSWLSALRNDKTLIFKASAQAAKASQYLNDFQKEFA
ncbi:MAG: zincin-like metallopeptidase domain-containing protein [Reichenbachiella sp.]|uniref:ArdC family protein n=1 Tax=Reichenbachiella sp. TaxID=2184521 RepID=UPI002966AED8|nr:zincin-like metallopeptidase domain-containing protein [Reichenbachiella sp.]MDW3210295.1 zincin-like metallopeptidase domain-containing protein [Reichenbachiella sp.]